MAKGKAAGKAKAPAKKKPRKKYDLEVAVDVQRDLEEIVRTLPDVFPHVDTNRVVCFRSVGATARIYARIWSLPRIWQMALGVQAHYAIEVVEAYDRQKLDDRLRTLIHELMHIPKTFSGNLVPHKCFGKNIDCDSVEVWFELYQRRRLGIAPPPEPPARKRARARAAPKPTAPAPAPVAAPPARPPRAPVAAAGRPLQLTLDPY